MPREVRVSTGTTTSEPVTVDDLLTHLKVDTTGDTGLVASQITGARVKLEERTRRSFMVNEFDLYFDRDEFPAGSEPLTIARVPLVSITSITAYDSTDGSATFSSTAYSVDTASEPGRVYLNSGQSWPSSLRQYNGVIVRFKAGYGTTQSDVPEPLREAIRKTVTETYERRGMVAVGNVVTPWPAGVEELIGPYLQPEVW